MPDCTHAPAVIAALNAVAPLIKQVGLAAGILGAVAAWLINKFLGWCVWMVERFLKRRDLMKALLAEIRSNSEAEAVYYPRDAPTGRTPAAALKLIESLRAQLGPDHALAPYVAVAPGNPIFEMAIDTITLLPSSVVEPIVSYYSASVSLTNQLQDFRSEPYLKLSQARQEEVIKGVWSEIGREVQRAAESAIKELNQALKRGTVIQYCTIGLIVLVIAAWSSRSHRGRQSSYGR